MCSACASSQSAQGHDQSLRFFTQNRPHFLLRCGTRKGPVRFGTAIEVALFYSMKPCIQKASFQGTISLLVVFLTRVSRWLLPLCPCNMSILIRRLTCNFLLSDIRQWWSTGLVVDLLQPARRHHFLRRMQGDGIAREVRINGPSRPSST
jgi:hypothetical protein